MMNPKYLNMYDPEENKVTEFVWIQLTVLL